MRAWALTALPALLALPSPTRAARLALEDRRAAPQALVIYWTRHALSCANLKASGWGGRPRAPDASDWPEDDPILSDCGAFQAAGAGRKLAPKLPRQLDGVYSSSLLRTMQTAHYMFGGTVTPLPYISEVPNGRDRQDYPISNLEQQKTVLDGLGVSADFRWMDAIPESQRVEDGQGRVQWELNEAEYPNASHKEVKRIRAQAGMAQFLDFVRLRLLPTLPQKHTLRIAVATHGTFLGMNFHPTADSGLCKETIEYNTYFDSPSVKNSEVLAVEYQIEEDTLVPLLCRRVAEGTKKPADICERDFESCRLQGKPLELVSGECRCTPE